MTGIVFFIVLLAVLVGSYFVVHKFYPNLGTVAMNLVAIIIPAFQQLPDALSALPWSSVLSEARTASVMFAIAAANLIVRVYKLTQGT